MFDKQNIEDDGKYRSFSGFIRELGAAERIYCREQADYGNQILVQVIIANAKININESTARSALLRLYHDYFPVFGYEICPSNDKTTLVYKAKDARQAEQDLMANFKYEQVNLIYSSTKNTFAVRRMSIGMKYLNES